MMPQILPKDSLVLVTGANGYLGSHLAESLLENGYRVRGTVRNPEKSIWLQEYLDRKHGGGRFEMVQVVNISKPNCFDEVVKGVSAFAHMASDLSMNPDPSISVTPMVESVKRALEATATEPGCRSFVLTSSCVAAVTARPNTKYHIDRDCWNEAAIKEAFTKPHDSTPSKRWAVYGASKALGEQAAWKFIREHRPTPHFTFNAIVPNANFGAIIDPQNQGGSAAGWIRALYIPEAFPQLVEGVKPQWFVHTSDTIKLHVACLTNQTLNGERLFAFGEPFHWNGVLTILRRLSPPDHLKDLPEDLDEDQDDRDLSTVDNERALHVLKEYCGQETWLSLEQGLKDLIDSIF